MGLQSVLAQFRLTASPGLRRDADSEFGRRCATPSNSVYPTARCAGEDAL